MNVQDFLKNVLEYIEQQSTVLSKQDLQQFYSELAGEAALKWKELKHSRADFFNWSDEKAKVLADAAWKATMCQDLGIANPRELESSLQNFFKWLEETENLKTAKVMKGHFPHWHRIPTRP